MAAIVASRMLIANAGARVVTFLVRRSARH